MMQVKEIVKKTKGRALVRQLRPPVLEDVCLCGCPPTDTDIEYLCESRHPVVFRKRQLSVLDSSTWVEGNAAAYKD